MCKSKFKIHETGLDEPRVDRRNGSRRNSSRRTRPKPLRESGYARLVAAYSAHSGTRNECQLENDRVRKAKRKYFTANAIWHYNLSTHTYTGMLLQGSNSSLQYQWDTQMHSGRAWKGWSGRRCWKGLCALPGKFFGRLLQERRLETRTPARPQQSASRIQRQQLSFWSTVTFNR